MCLLRIILFCFFTICGSEREGVPGHAKLQDIRKNPSGHILAVKRTPLPVVPVDIPKMTPLRINKPDGYSNTPKIPSHVPVKHANNKMVNLNNRKFETESPIYRIRNQVLETAQPNHNNHSKVQEDNDVHHTATVDGDGVMDANVTHDDHNKIAIHEDNGKNSEENIGNKVKKMKANTIVTSIDDNDIPTRKAINNANVTSITDKEALEVKENSKILMNNHVIDDTLSEIKPRNKTIGNSKVKGDTSAKDVKAKKIKIKVGTANDLELVDFRNISSIKNLEPLSMSNPTTAEETRTGETKGTENNVLLPNNNVITQEDLKPNMGNEIHDHDHQDAILHTAHGQVGGVYDIQHIEPNYTYVKPPFHYPFSNEVAILDKMPSPNEIADDYRNNFKPFYTYSKITSMDASKKIWRWNTIQLNLPVDIDLQKSFGILSQFEKDARLYATLLRYYNQNVPEVYPRHNNYCYTPYRPNTLGSSNYYNYNNRQPSYSYNNYQSPPCSYYNYRNNFDYYYS